VTWGQRLSLAVGSARGLAYLHTFKPPAVHRDIKSPNLLITADFQAKVADFGTMCEMKEGEHQSAPDVTHMMTRQIAGTFPYMAPEYIQTGRITVKLDAFALGMVLLELLTGKKPSAKMAYQVEEHMPGIRWDRHSTMGPPFRDVLDRKVKQWTLPLAGGGADEDGSNGPLEVAKIALAMMEDDDKERLSVVDALPQIEALLQKNWNWNAQWNAQQVASWIEGIDDGQLTNSKAAAKAVLDNNVDGLTMSDLNKEDLREIGITSGIARSKIFREWGTLTAIHIAANVIEPPAAARAVSDFVRNSARSELESLLMPPSSWEEPNPAIEFFPGQAHNQITSPSVVVLDSNEKALVLAPFVEAFEARGLGVCVAKVERVQNLPLWQSYAIKRKNVLERENALSSSNQRFERIWLFHGTDEDTCGKIQEQGFNRSFCGKNATAYGKGVYFARDSTYAARPAYAVPDANGVQRMFACRVLIGQYCQGENGALTPAVRTEGILYDSTCNRVSDPSIFVTYHDAQAYPEYLIQFTCETPAAPPAAPPPPSAPPPPPPAAAAAAAAPAPPPPPAPPPRIRTSNIGKYLVGQAFNNGTLSGFIESIEPDTPGAQSGPGVLRVGASQPLFDPATGKPLGAPSAPAPAPAAPATKITLLSRVEIQWKGGKWQAA
jgi:poly [ADP-ribose] polymerase 10/14/15